MIKGSLEVICGPMFCGKSEELIRRIRRALIAKQEVCVVKPAMDKRYSDTQLVSHNGTRICALPVSTSAQLYESVHAAEAHAVGIDEAQFFDAGLTDVINALVSEGKRVIVAGLDRDFRGLPFGCMPALLALADAVTKLHAICTECGSDAALSQRLVNGKPAAFNDPIILVGAQEAYQARCRSCYVITGAPAHYTMRETTL